MGLCALAEVLTNSIDEADQEQGEIHLSELIKEYPYNPIGYIIFYKLTYNKEDTTSEAPV